MWRTPLCLCHRSFHRVQSPRNLARSCWSPVVQLFLPASAESAPRLDHLGCHSDLGLLLCRLLSEFAPLLFGLVCEASDAASVTAHEEHPLRVSFFPLLSLMQPLQLILIISLIAILEQSLPRVSVLFKTEQGFGHSLQFFFTSFRSCIVSFVWTSSSTLARSGGTAVLSCELNEAASLFNS